MHSLSTSKPQLSAHGIALNTSPEYFGELTASNALLPDRDALQARMERDGYLFFRDFLDRDRVLAARREILLKYAIAGEIDTSDHDVMDGIYSENTFISQVNARALSESIRTGACYDALVHDPALIDLYARLLGGPVRTFDFRWARFVRPGEGCGFHADAPYVSRGTRRLYSTWIPIGDVSMVEGALLLLENSHKSPHIHPYVDSDADREQLGWFGVDPLALQQRLGGRWLSADFKAGDAICFSIDIIHGTFDNNSPSMRCRLCSDTRYQRDDAPLDDRWNGSDLDPHRDGRVFLPGLIKKDENKKFFEEWKPVDRYGRLAL